MSEDAGAWRLWHNEGEPEKLRELSDEMWQALADAMNGDKGNSN